MKSIPDCVWSYWGIIGFMGDHPGFFSMDDMRTAAHEEVCNYFHVTREQTAPITNNLNRYGWPHKDPSLFVMALRELSKTGKIITFPNMEEQ